MFDRRRCWRCGLRRHRRWGSLQSGWRYQRRCDLRNLGLKRRPRAWLQRNRHESRQNFQRGGKRRRGGLRPQHWRQRVGRLAAATGGHDVGHGLMQLIGGTLDALQVVSESSRDQLLDGEWCVGVG